MAGNVKFESSSVSPEDSSFSGSYPNGQRSTHSGPNLDRSGSFREGSDGRSFSSGTSTFKSNATAVADLPPLSQCLLLEPISMGDQKYTRAGELRRALGFSFGNVSEDNYFGVAYSKPAPTLATDELKRFRASVQEGWQKARIRTKRLDESLNKLNKYCEALVLKRQQTNERSGGSNLLKMGAQSHRSSSDLVTQKLEERSKNFGLNKRARTLVGDLQAEGRSSGVQRQHLALAKDKDAAKDGSSDLVEEKIRRLPAGGEGWDKKMKRKRSVSSVFPRPVDGDGELKRAMHGRLGNDTGIQNSDSVCFRGSSNGANGINKLDGVPSPASLTARMTPKNESEKPPISREVTGMNKERLLQKGNMKLNIREDTHLFSPTSVTKGKASRAHRTGSVAAGNSSSSFPRLSGTPEDWEQPLNVSKVHSLAGVNNRKRPLPSESSGPMAQWVGQRPQKISRNRRRNIVSPTSNHDEAQISSEGCDFSVRVSGGMNGSLPVRNSTGGSQQQKVKLENAQSPARLSESEENSAVDYRLKGKVLCGSQADERGINGHQHANLPGLFTKKSKLVVKEEIGEAVHRQGRTGRGLSFSRGGMSPLREKLDNPAGAKPVRSTRPASEKNGSKSGRPPLKKQSDRKGFTRLGTLPNSSSSDFTGESDDDREELIAAAQFACNASYNGCSTVFWKRMEPLFCIRLEDKSFLDEQLKSVGEHRPNMSEMPGLGHDIVESKKLVLDNGLIESAKDRVQEHDSLYGGLDTGRRANTLTPLYQRVLSALIVEDEFEEDSFGSCAASLSNGNDPSSVADRISSNGNTTHSRYPSIQVSLHEEMEEGDYRFRHPLGRSGCGAFQNDANGLLPISLNACGDSALQCEYDQMCMDEKLLLELQRFGLSPARVPDLADREDELINQDIGQIKMQLGQQAGKKRAYLDRIHKAIEQKKESEGRALEELAMNRLTELAFKKLLATRGSSATRIGLSKVSRHVALAFIRRALARCRTFEDAGKSCFSEPALRDVLFAAPSNNAGALNCISHAEQNMLLDARTSGSYSEQLDIQNEKSERGAFDAYEHSDQAFAKNGPILNRGKKKEVLLDDVGSNAAIRSTSNLGSNLLGGAKGKRSERDSGGKAGRPLIANLRGERKTKSKPKQKAAQVSTHTVQPSANALNKKREGLISPGNILDSSKDSKDCSDLGSLLLHELDPIEELSVANEFGGHQDLSSWLNFDEDGLQDHDSMGLEIPMDDLSELSMLL